MAFKQVDIAKKPVVYREATASGRIRLKPTTIERIKEGKVEKGDPLSLAAVTAILAVKQTPAIVALSHPLKIESTLPKIDLGKDWVQVTVTVSAHDKTGVEMEALTAVSVALLNIWDLAKAYEKNPDGQYPSTKIEFIRVTRKVKEKV